MVTIAALRNEVARLDARCKLLAQQSSVLRAALETALGCMEAKATFPGDEQRVRDALAATVPGDSTRWVRLEDVERFMVPLISLCEDSCCGGYGDAADARAWLDGVKR